MPPGLASASLLAPRAHVRGCAQGTAYGPCAGEVTPLAEVCATPADDDCDGTVNESCAPTSCAGLPAGSPSGTYNIDPDGPGGAAPFAAHCDMTTDGGGWTLCFAYDNSVYDSGEWPSIPASRNKMLAKQWGTTSLFGDGTKQGNFCNLLAVVPGTTRLRAEVVVVQNSQVLNSGRFLLAEAGFFTQIHDPAVGQFDCLVDSTGGKRLLYGNYTVPSRIFNQEALNACSGPADQHVNASIGAQAHSYGVDGFLIMTSDASGVTPEATNDLSLHVSWYADVVSQSLYVSPSNAIYTKFGTTATWVANGYGRSGASPGLSQCYTYCGYTNVVNNVLKQRLWLK